MSQKMYLIRRVIPLILLFAMLTAAASPTFAQNDLSSGDVDVSSGSDVTSDSDVSDSDENPPQENAPLLLVVMTTELPIGSTMSFSINSSGNVFVDWGNGAAVPTTAEPGQLTRISGHVEGSELKIYATAAIKNLVITRMELTAIDAKVESLDVCGNYLTFEKLPSVDSFSGGYYYSPQSVITLPESVMCGRTVDLSSCAVAYDRSGFAHYTEYRWFDSSGEQVYPSLEINGRFAFDDEFAGKTLRCEMRNELFPELVLRSSYIEVVEHDPTNPRPQKDDSDSEEQQTPQEEQRESANIAIVIAIGANLVVMGALSASDKLRKKACKGKNRKGK